MIAQMFSRSSVRTWGVDGFPRLLFVIPNLAEPGEQFLGLANVFVVDDGHSVNQLHQHYPESENVCFCRDFLSQFRSGTTGLDN